MRRGHHGDPGNASPRPRGRVSASMPSGWRRLVRECLKRTVLWPIVLILRAYERHLARRDPRKLQALRYRRTMGIALHIDNPVSLDDKINYMSFCTDTALWTELTDKLKVREYVKACGLGGLLNELYGVYHTPDDIDFSRLPNAFVLKTNHASATNIFVADKRVCDTAWIRKQIKIWLDMDYGLQTATPHYSRIQPCIMAEKYMVDTHRPGMALTDYKIYCFSGKPHYIFVFSDRLVNTHSYKTMIYDSDWNPRADYIRAGKAVAHVTPKPASLDRMLASASVLSRSFPFVRVDLFEINGNPVFGEMTFTPGHDSGASIEFLKVLGGLVDLEPLRARREA